MEKSKGVIEVKNLTKIYTVGSEHVVALSNINFSVNSGEVCCILGTSGSGKSTLLNMLAGLEKPTRGEIQIEDKRIDKMNENTVTLWRQKNVGFIFQSYNLLSGITALENVAMPLIFRGVKRSKRNRMARAMLSLVGLANRVNHVPSQMSGGQQQRVGIARAFVSNPKIVFADEPTGNLDTKTTKDVMELMVKLSHKYKHSLIIVTHDRDIAAYADRVITIRDGIMVSNEIINKNESEEVANQ